MTSALNNLRVLDLSRVLAGPLTTMMLADFGATVLKVERPATGDDTRQWGPPFDDRGTATYFQSVNRNKQSIVIDLQTRAGISQIQELSCDADVLVENFRPGLMNELGLGYAALSIQNPGLIYCSVTGFGPDAPELPGYDLLVQALGGLMSITGEPSGGPQKAGVALVDVLAGLFSTIGILTALNHRNRTGEGQLVEVDLMSCLLAALVNQGSAYTVAGIVGHRMGNAHPSIAPYALYGTGDGQLVLAVGNDRQFQALGRVLGNPAIGSDPRYLTNADRVARRDELRADLETLLAARPAAEWAALLTVARVPAGVVNDIAGAFSLATQLGLKPTVDLPRTDGTTVTLTRNPVRLSRTPASHRCAPPELDQNQGNGWGVDPVTRKQ